MENVLHCLVDCSGSMRAWNKSTIVSRLIHNLLSVQILPAYVFLRHTNLVVYSWHPAGLTLITAQGNHELKFSPDQPTSQATPALESCIAMAQAAPLTVDDFSTLQAALTPQAQAADLALLQSFMDGLASTTMQLPNQGQPQLSHKVLLFTDGNHIQPHLSTENADSSQAQHIHAPACSGLAISEQIKLSVIGIGPDLNEEGLQNLSSTGLFFTPIDMDAALKNLEFIPVSLPSSMELNQAAKSPSAGLAAQEVDNEQDAATEQDNDPDWL